MKKNKKNSEEKKKVTCKTGKDFYLVAGDPPGSVGVRKETYKICCNFIKDKNKFKNLLSNSQKKTIVKAILLITAILIPFIFPLFTFTSGKINFYIEGNKNKFRAVYPISFRWDISTSISQALIIWGDGTTYDIRKDHSGSLNHSYDLQGKYTPTLFVWDSTSKSYSKPIDVKIENDLLDFNIKVEDEVFEGQETRISVDDIFK